MLHAAEGLVQIHVRNIRTNFCGLGNAHLRVQVGAVPNDNEIALMKHKQILFSALQITAQPENSLKKLMAKKITAIAWDYIEDKSGSFPLVRSMGEIAGTSSFLIAAELMSNANNGKGLMMGGVAGITPPELVIIGAGTWSR